MSLSDRIIQSLEFLQPCSVERLWKVMMMDLTSDKVSREQVYRVLYRLSRKGVVDHFGHAQYRLSVSGESKSRSLRKAATLFE
jgi:hypothetical protein